MRISKKFLVISATISAIGISGAVAQRVLSEPERTAMQAKILADVTSEVLSRLNSMEKAPELRSDLGEHIIKDEPEAIQSATDAVIKTIMNRAFSGVTAGVVKGDHGKSQACLKGEIVFSDEIPESLQKGVVVPGARYKVEGRLSNAEEPGRNDRSSTSQGVALKLKNISKVVRTQGRLSDFSESDEQDFLMTSAPIFFLSNIVEYNVAFGLRAGGGKISSTVGTILTTPKLWPRMGTEIMAKIRAAAAVPGNPKNILTHPYWSKHPYAWGVGAGSSAIKYGVAQCDNASKLTVTSKQTDYQKEFIKEAFSKNQEICFYLRIQQRPADATEQSFPIENGNVEWNEEKAPFVNVAKVIFSAQANEGWETPESQASCGRTEFSPWNGLVAHQPMSNLARGRRYVYKASAIVRELKDRLDPQILVAKDAPKESLVKRLNPVKLLKRNK